MSLSVHLLKLFVCYFLTTNHIRAQNIATQIKTFSDQLESLTCDGLAVGGDKCMDYGYGIQDFIYSFTDHFESDNEDASVLAQNIMDRLNTKLNLRASFLTNLSNVIRSECYFYADNIESESIIDFNDLYFAGNKDRDANLPTTMEYSPVYQDTVSFAASTYKIPNGVAYDNENIQADAQMSQLLDNTMIKLYNDHCIDEEGKHEYCSMYLGSINGVFRQFPGVENAKLNGNYKDYDPRFRPWYVSAATGSKDVVILLDISGSMRENNRIELAKDAVVSVLNTLGSSSFVNVVAFSDTITRTCFENNLVPATSRNIAELVRFVTDLEPGGTTDFEIAFNAAFDILSTGKSCETSILFLTDGIADDVSRLILQRNTIDINAVIFSYTLGSAAAAKVPKKVAELTDGLYTHIDDGDENLITAMSSYYLYYAYGSGSHISDEYKDIIITSPYVDFDTGVIMITMSMPIYFNSTYFVGVVGTDIPLTFLADAIGDITIGRKSYSFVMNEESELILHPLIPNAFELFDNNKGYKPIFVSDVEPEEFNSSGILLEMLQGKHGQMNIAANIRQPAGNVAYNGYIHEDANLLYIYGPVGPSSLRIAIVIYSESDVDAPYVPAFGLKSSPSEDCNETITANNIDIELDECLAPFNLYHRIDLAVECNSSWVNKAMILNGSDPVNSHLPYNAFYEGQLYSPEYPIYYLQSGLYEHQFDALNTYPSCEQLEEIHRLTNRLGSVNFNQLPYGGFRSEISSNILNSIYTLSSIHEFWKPSFLANNSLFVSMWFGHYQGLHISYPAKKFKPTYNNQIRPWYQRALSYPEKSVWTTPYKHAVTGKLVTGASTVVYAPGSNYAYGVLGFNYEYTAFVTYWKSVMNTVCDNENKNYCYLVDSSAFVLYYKGMEEDVEDIDISRKFFGDLEPTLMQTLLTRGLFVHDRNVNFQDDTISITYVIDETVYNTEDFESQSTSFGYNNGEYTVHAVSKTNLYVIHIENYLVTNVYPQVSDCMNDKECANVVSPGCIQTTSGDCKSATVDVCVEPDSIISSELNNIQCSIINELGICVLKSDTSESDMCASNFMELNEECQDTKGDEKDNETIIIIVVIVGIVVILCIILIMFYWRRKHNVKEGMSVQMATNREYTSRYI